MKRLAAIIIMLAAIWFPVAVGVYSSTSIEIDDDTVITVIQAGSIAKDRGSYGWDSRGAEFKYHSLRGDISGSLGDILFSDRDGHERMFLWSEWGNRFPDWWGRMLADRVRESVPDSQIPAIRKAFEETMYFDCVWLIAIGTKSSKVNGSLYKTLRTDGTLRVAYNRNLEQEEVPELLFKGDAMSSSLSAILKGSSWGSASQNTFADRNPYSYALQINSYDVGIYATNCVTCAKRGLENGGKCSHLQEGTYFKKRIPIYHNGKAYEQDNSFAWEGQSVSFSIPELNGYVHTAEGDDYSGVRGNVKSGIITPTGDSTVFILYKAVQPVREPLTIKYITLNSSGTAAKTVVKEELHEKYIEVGAGFELELEESFRCDGTDYRLLNSPTGLSYSQSPRYINAVNGIKAYKVTPMTAGNRVIYRTGTNYEPAAAGTLYVPVEEICEKITPTAEPTLTPTQVPTQTPEIPPFIEPTGIPEITPAVTPTGTPTGTPPNTEEPEIPVIRPEQPERESMNLRSSPLEAEVSIKSQYFDVGRAIPSSEKVFITGTLSNCLYDLKVSKISGKFPLRIWVNIPYKAIWNEQGEEMIEEAVYVRAVDVLRDYSYLHLESFSYYSFEQMSLYNRALSVNEIAITADMAEIAAKSWDTPVSYGGASPVMGGNIDYPEGFQTNPVYNGTIVINSQTGYPDLAEELDELAASFAEASVGDLRCRNDEIISNGVNILGSTGWHSGEERDTELNLPAEQSLKLDSREIETLRGLYIPAEVRNGKYETLPAFVIYRRTVIYGNDAISYTPVISVNPVHVHTPVVGISTINECNPEKPNSTYNQESQPGDGTSFGLVEGTCTGYGSLGHEHDSADFYLEIANSGFHPVYGDILGDNYDYRYNADRSGSYVLSNEVFFPFDVMWDVGDDRKTDNDILLEGKRWHELANGKSRFYIPDYVSEGDYVIETATRAINSVSREDLPLRTYSGGRRNLTANENEDEYAVRGSIKVHVSGKLYGLTLFDAGADPDWKDVFTRKTTEGEENKFFAMPIAYSDGTLAVTANGTGANKTVRSAELDRYAFYYTVGTNNELGFATGRAAKFTLPTIAGSSPVAERSNTGMQKSGYCQEFMFRSTGSRGAEDGSLAEIRLEFSLTEKDGSNRRSVELYERRRNSDGTYELQKINTGLTAVKKPVGTGAPNLVEWFFKINLPSTLYVREKDGKVYIPESGCIAVNAAITIRDSKGRSCAEYNPAEGGPCNMWVTEGQQFMKTDFYGNEFNFIPGDILLLYAGTGAGDDFIADKKY